MARKWKVHLLKGKKPIDVEIVADTQSEAEKIAETQNPGYKYACSRDLGPAN